MNLAKRARPLLLCLPLALLALAVPAQTTPAGEIQAVLHKPGDAARGKAAFEECSACHRKDAAGRATVNIPRLAGQHAPVIVKQILDIRSGLRLNPRMKAVLDEAPLDNQTVADIAAYLQGLPVPAGNTKGPGRDTARGKALFEKDCADCHGATGGGRAERFYPAVSAQHYGYLLRELNLIRDGERGNSNAEMVQRLKPYTPEDLQALAYHMAGLPPSN